MQIVVDFRGRIGFIPVNAAKARIVQRINKLRTDLIDELHHRLRFRNRLMEMQILIVNRECPVHLLEAGRTEEIARIVVERIRTLEPLLIEHQSVIVPRFDDIPGIIQLIAQGFVLCQRPGEVFQHHRADRLVGVRAAEHQCDMLAAGNLHALKGAPFLGLAEGEHGHDVRIFLRQRERAFVQLLRSQEFLVIRNLAQQLLIDRFHAYFPF